MSTRKLDWAVQTIDKEKQKKHTLNDNNALLVATKQMEAWEPP